jgi:peptidoglycan/xylan/chitin deacetylase (PgdA/CDA1 family)
VSASPRRRQRQVARLAVPAGLLVLAAVVVAIVAASGSSGTAQPARAARHVAARRAPAPRPPAHPALVPPTNPAPRSVRVPILMYHRVHRYATELTKSLPDLTIEPQRFAAQIAGLQQAGYRSITIAQLFGALFHGAALPAKPVLITVDDGYVDDVTQILPVLLAHHLTAAFYIITGRFHEAGFVSEAQVRQLDAAGMDIGAHTRHHLDLPSLGAAQMQDEVAGSRQDLERVLHHPIASFAYPAGSYDAAAIDVVRRAGFAIALTTNAGAEDSSLHPFELPRIRVGRDTTPAQLLACVAGGYGCG